MMHACAEAVAQAERQGWAVLLGRQALPCCRTSQINVPTHFLSSLGSGCQLQRTTND